MEKCSGHDGQGMHKHGGSKPVLTSGKMGKRKGAKKGSFKKA